HELDPLAAGAVSRGSTRWRHAIARSRGGDFHERAGPLPSANYPEARSAEGNPMSAQGLRATLAAALVALFASFTSAHEFKLEALMNSFVKIDGGEAHFVIRVPIYLFKSVRFPVKGVEIDAAKSGDALERAAAALQRDVTI